MPLTWIVAWVKGVNIGLDFSLLDTASPDMTILVYAFTLQVAFIKKKVKTFELSS